MVHQYINNGYHIVVDVNSGAIHVVDEVVYDVIPLFEKHSSEEITGLLREKYSEEEIREAVEEVSQLKKEGSLFTPDTYEAPLIDFKKRPTVVKALCLHIAHDCNLACRYCFAEEGEYHGRRALMSYETGKAALDFLIANSGSRRNLEVDFFGGEPLMNFEVVKQLVAYGREQEKLHDKHFRFTLTTNGVLLNDDIMEFANREMDNVVLSIDGRKEVHDHMRPFRKGAGSYDLIVPKFQQFAESRHQDKYYVRGTFTHYNLDFSEDVLHLADLGFKQISVEPVVAEPKEPYAIREEDLPKLFEEYDKLAVKLGVKDYILKPVDPSEFSSTITGVITELDEEHKKDEDYNRQANFIKQYYMYTLLNSGDASGILDNGDILSGNNRLALKEFNTDFFGKYDTGEDIFKEITGELDYQYLNLNPLQSVIIFSDKSFTADGNIDKNIEEMFTNIHDYIYRKTGQFMYIAVSGLFNDYHELPQVMDAVETLMNNKFYETGRYIFSDNISEDTPVLVQIDDDALMKQLKQDIKMKDVEALREHFQRFCEKYRHMTEYSQIYIKFLFSNLM